MSVATGWVSSTAARVVDAPALANPVQIRSWLASITESQQADLIGRMDSQLLLGEQVVVIGILGSWVKVIVPDQPTPKDSRGYPVWIPRVQLSPIAPAASSQVATVVSPTAWLETDSGRPLLEISFGTSLPVLDALDGRLLVALPAGGRAWIATADAIRTVAGAAAQPRTGASVVASAEAFLGLRYLWSGTSGFGFDCSGIVHLDYRVHGVALPRDADAQATAGWAVARSDLRAGDLVFFARSGSVHHVALYTGDGQLLDAPGVGELVRTYALSAVSSLETLTYRRILP